MVTINGSLPPVYDPKTGKTPAPGKAVNAAENMEAVDAQEVLDKRRVPDRRRQNQPWNQPERRQRKRRSPQLLNARDGKPESLTESKGHHIDTAV